MLVFVVKRTLTPLSGLRFLSSSSSSSEATPHFMSDYLITTCGFSPDKATKLSKTFTHLKSPDRPDAVLRFLKHHAFTPSDIRRLLSIAPSLLAQSVRKTLAPNMSALLAAGFISAIPRYVIRNPTALSHHTHTLIASRIHFWTDFFSGDLRALRSAFNRNRNLIAHDVQSSMPSKITLLNKEFGLSHTQIQKLVLLGSFITRSQDSIRILLDRTLNAGFSKESPMFVYGLFAFSSNGTAAINAKMEFMKRYGGWSETEFLSTFLKFPLFTRLSIQNIQAKMEFMKSFGWSEKEFFSALLKTPLFTCLSRENIQAKMDFLLGQAGCTPSYVALNPLILAFSLEKRLIPRHHILEILKAKGVRLKKPKGLRSIMAQTDKVFVKMFILRYQEKVPGLQEAYNAACTGNMAQPKTTQ